MEKCKVLVILTEGVEVTESLTAVNLLRRAGFDVQTASIDESEVLRTKSNIYVRADVNFVDADKDVQALVLPGGPGHVNYAENSGLVDLLHSFNSQGRIIAAICAAPTVLGKLGLLKGKRAACYPGLENGLIEAEVCYDKVVKDGNIITSRGPGTTVEFALAIIEELGGRELAHKVAGEFVYI